MNRHLASVQKILSIYPIDGADKIECADILGWHVVIEKGKYHTGDLVVYCEIDSVLPNKPEFEFLKDVNYKIRTRKFKGQISQGICFPLSILPATIGGPAINDKYDPAEGEDVTDLLSVTKWEPKLPVHLAGLSAGYLPSYIPHTDEMRIQSVPDVLTRNKGIKCYVTEKLDGTSLSAWRHEGEFFVGSRRLILKETEDNTYWKAIKRLGLDRTLPDECCIQGELIGPGIQKNKYQLKDYEIRWFNSFDIVMQQYVPFLEFEHFIEEEMKLKMVPVIGIIELGDSIDTLIETLAKGKSQLAPIQREGAVIRSIDEMTDLDLGRLSFKVINPDFLLKYEE